METNTEFYIDLITKYLSGEATPDEISGLGTWVKASPENAALFAEYLETWKSIEKAGTKASINIDQEWNSLKSLLPRPSSLVPPPSSLVPRPSSLVPHPSSLLLSWPVRIAALLILILVPAFLVYRSYMGSDKLNFKATGGISEYTLPDGTKVTLNDGASLSCPRDFAGAMRKISLDGEAWFEVTHDPDHPFVVDAGHTMVQVLGTSFSVNTNAYGNTKEIILLTGKVKVFLEDMPGKPVFLAPRQKATVSETNQEITKSLNEDENFLAWKTKHLVFNNTPLNEVVALLTQVYHTSIRLSDNRLSGCRITTTFDRQSLESVLNVLKATLDLQVKNTGEGIELSGRGCGQVQ